MVKNSLFYRIFFYTGLESIVYQAILCSHQVMLFRLSDTSLYGQAGVLFSGIFLLVLYLNMGLDTSLAPVFKLASQSKESFKSIILKQFLSILIIPFVLAGIYFLYPLDPATNSSTGVLIVCGMLVLIESVKKTVRTLLHLALLQKVVAFVEIATLILYVATVWAYIFTNKPLNLYVIFLPMLISSSVALCIYLFYLCTFYTQLPERSATDIFKPIACMRFKNWIYQILHSLYSSNFLIFSIAQLYGFELAALLKIISFCTYSINYIVQHVFGIASSVLFAHAKDSSSIEKQQFFSTIRSRLAYVLMAVPIILLGYHWYLYIVHPNLCAEHVHTISLFMILLFSENIAVTHEQFYIVENRTGLLIVCNAALLIPCFIAQRNMCPDSPTVFIYILIITRLAVFLCLHYFDKFSHLYAYIMQQKYKLLFAEK